MTRGGFYGSDSLTREERTFCHLHDLFSGWAISTAAWRGHTPSPLLPKTQPPTRTECALCPSSLPSLGHHPLLARLHDNTRTRVSATGGDAVNAHRQGSLGTACTVMDSSVTTALRSEHQQHPRFACEKTEVPEPLSGKAEI